MVQVENSLAHVRVSKDLWMLRSLMGLDQAGWGGVGGKGHSFWNHINDFPWGHRRKWNLHLMKYRTSSVLILFWFHAWLTIKIRLDPAIKLLKRDGEEGAGQRRRVSGQEGFGGAGRGEVSTRVPGIPVQACIWSKQWLGGSSSSAGWNCEGQVWGWAMLVWNKECRPPLGSTRIRSLATEVHPERSSGWGTLCFGKTGPLES